MDRVSIAVMGGGSCRGSPPTPSRAILLISMLKNRVFGSILGVVLTISIGFICCGRPEVAWRGTIQEVDGVTVVKNPNEPMHEEDACRLEEDLSIEQEEVGDEYPFSEVRDLAVDEEQNIYVLDFKEPFIRVFDKFGKRLLTIGKRGQGPGEIQGPTSLCVTSRGELLVNDRGNRFLHIYTMEGTHRRSISLARWPMFSRPAVDDQDNIIARCAVTSPGRGWIFVLKKFDPGLQELFDIFAYLMDVTPNVYDIFPPDCFWKVRSDGRIVWGYADKYELRILDGDGRVIRRIIRDYVPVGITGEEKNAWVQFAFGDTGVPASVKLNWPRYHNAFQFLSLDDKDRMFIQTYEKTTNGKGTFCDIFDPGGKFMAKIALKGTPRVVKNNKIYTIEEDEQGYQVVKRYKISWKF